MFAQLHSENDLSEICSRREIVRPPSNGVQERHKAAEMMRLIVEDLITQALDPDVCVTSLLRKAKVVYRNSVIRRQF